MEQHMHANPTVRQHLTHTSRTLDELNNTHLTYIGIDSNILCPVSLTIT